MQSRNVDWPVLFKSINWEDKSFVSYQLKKLIHQSIQEIVGDKLKIGLADIKLEHPSNENYGDYATNLALILAGKLKLKPYDLTKQIKGKLDQYIKEYQSTAKKTDSSSEQADIFNNFIQEKVEIAGPGFINLWLHHDFLSSELAELLSLENTAVASCLGNKRILVEFAHPNTHKEFHIGHLRNISLGEAIVRILESCGGKLFRANYQGDVGLHVAKAIWGTKIKIKNEKLKMKKLRILNPAEKAKFLGEAYALGSKAYEEDKRAQKEIIALNVQIYKDPSQLELWKETREWSLEYFDSIYKRLGSHFDRLFFESEVEKPGREMVYEGVKKGIFTKDKDGSIYFPGEKYGLNNCVFVTRENYATYEGKEIACEELEYETFPYDLSINNVAGQSNFFQISYKATEILFPRHKGKHFNLAYGMVNFKSGKLSSRTGQVITADWLIDEAKLKILKLLKPGYSKEEQVIIAEKVAVAAVKYSMLRVNPKMDIAFDLEESVSLEGDSGPYLMYTYARCKSVMRKAELSGHSEAKRNEAKESSEALPSVARSFATLRMTPNPEELSLLRTFYRFSEVVVEAARTLSPNLLCSFLFDLAQKYNLFYNKHSILNPESRKDTWKVALDDSFQVEVIVKSFRLALTQATSIILKHGLYLLGIETVERM